MSFADRKRELLIEKRYRRCKNDFFYFVETCWHIQHPEHGAMLFEPFDAQRRAFDVFQSERYVITLKARQIGWTTMVAAYTFWLAYFNSDRLIIFLSKGDREARNILRMVDYGEKRLPSWLRQRGAKRLNQNLKDILLSNGSAIESLPSGTDPARGRSCYLVIVDEWAFLDNPDEAWASIEPIADVGGRVIGLSTANGFGNFFQTLWTGSTTKEGTGSIFTPIFEPWGARDDRDDEWYAVKKATLPEWQLHQEYPRNPEEAFLKSGNPFFDVDKLVATQPVEPRRGRISSLDGRRFIDEPGAPLRIFEMPQIGEMYVIGADVAEGLEFGDYSSADVISMKTGKQVAHYHGHVNVEDFATVLADLGHFYNRAYLGVEVNNHGLTVCKFLKEIERYPSIHYSHVQDEARDRKTRKIGWVTSRKTKPKMLDELAMELRNDGITVCCERTLYELKTFVRDEDAKLHGSPYDDSTMSLAIANQMRDHGRSYHASQVQAPWGSLKWWEQQSHEKKAKPAAIGASNRRQPAGAGLPWA